MIPLSGLKVKEVIVHEIPKGRAGEDSPDPLLSATSSPLTLGIRHFFERKIAETAGHKGCLGVQFDPDTQSSTPQLVEGLLSGACGLVETSQELAKNLAKIQTAVNSEGLLACVTFDHGSVASVAMMKLENEAGVRLVREHEGEERELRLELIEDLLLTEKTRVFKLAVFLRISSDEIDAHVADRQRSYTDSNAVADFFLKDFLGCEYRLQPTIATRNFLDATQNFLNESVDDDDERLKLAVDLISYLGTDASQIGVKDFAAKYMDAAQATQYFVAMESASVPIDNFVRDIDLVRSAVSNMMYIGKESKVAVIAPPSVARERFSTGQDEHGNPELRIQDSFRASRKR